jgi:hypothetical protein
MQSSNPPKGRNASKSTTHQTPPNRGRAPNKVTTTKKGSKEPRANAKASPRSTRGKNNNNNRANRYSGQQPKRQAPPEGSKKPRTSLETPPSSPGENEFEEPCWPPAQSPEAFLYEDAPPKLRLDELLKRTKSPGDKGSPEYGKLTLSQIEDTSKKIDKYEAIQRGKRSNNIASELDNGASQNETSDETNPDLENSGNASPSRAGKVGKDLAQDFLIAAKVPAKEDSKNNTTNGASATGGSSVKATPRQAITPATYHQIEDYERKLKNHIKSLLKADAAVNKESFVQETVDRLATHTTNVLITNPVAILTRKVHALTLKIDSYQAKAAKFVALPPWVPWSCRSKFVLSFPLDTKEDDPELIKLQETVAAAKEKYERALRRCIERKELFLLMKTLDDRRDVFASGIVAIAHDWLKLWLPRNKTVLRQSPLTLHPYQIVGIGLHRLLSLGCLELRNELDTFFNKELTLPQRLAWRVRHLPLFKTHESPERRIFQNSTEAQSATMYPYTKVTWDKSEYAKLESGARIIIDGPLKAFLTDLCRATTFEFHQKYEEDLDIKLAEIQIAARQKQEQTLKAAEETRKALEQIQRQGATNVQAELTELRNKVSQLQRTTQQQGIRLNASRNSQTNDNPEPKNSKGRRERELSVPPKDSSKGNQNGAKKAGRRRKPLKRKRPAQTAENPVKAIKTSQESQDSTPEIDDNPPPRNDKPTRKQQANAAAQNDSPGESQHATAENKEEKS